MPIWLYQQLINMFNEKELVKVYTNNNDITKLVITELTLEELPIYITYLAEKSVEFSNKLFEIACKNIELDLRVKLKKT